MNPPFTTGQFLNVFSAYNLAIWPAQITAYGLGVIAVAALWMKRSFATICDNQAKWCQHNDAQFALRLQ